MKSELVPRIRFGEFEGEWQVKRLSAVTDVFKSGSGITSDAISEVGTYPVYGGNGLRGYTDNFTHDGYYVLIGRQGALCGNINETSGKSYISEHAIAVRSNDDNDTKWLSYKLYKWKLNRLSESSAQPGLSVKKLLRLKSTYPPLPEQQKIAAFLTAVDGRLAGLRRQVAALERYKRGVMQGVFGQHLDTSKSENKTKRWATKKLDKVGVTYGGLSGKNKSHFGSGVGKYITYKQVFDDVFIDVNRVYNVDVGPKEKQNIVSKGDILFTTSSETRNEVGISSVYLGDENLYLNSFCFGFRPNSFDELDPEYAAYYFSSQHFRRRMYVLAQGSTRFNLSKGEFKKVKILLPSLPEQRRIATFLRALDDRIGLVERQLAGAEAFKRGLLQGMFV